MTRQDPRVAMIAKVIAGREAGHYDVPTEITDAYDTLLRLQGLSVPRLPSPGLEDAALALYQDPTVDPVDQAESLAAAQADERHADLAEAVVARSVTLAAGELIDIARYADDAIVGLLKQPFAELLDETRQVATVLEDYEVSDVRTMVTAPAPVRKAYTSLTDDLVARHRLLREARRLAYLISERTPRKDVADLFLSFGNAVDAFMPRRQKTQRMPESWFPSSDPVHALLFLASDDEQVVAAKPWIPTIAEQDEAWQSTFGKDADDTQARHALVHGGGAGGPMVDPPRTGGLLGSR